MKKIYVAILVAALVFALVYFMRLTPTGNVVSEGKWEDEQALITLEQLNEHNAASDCWVAYDGKVYDITSWLPVHPGSAAAIAPHCGTHEEFTQAFTQKHGTTKVATLMRVGTLMGDFDVVGSI